MTRKRAFTLVEVLIAVSMTALLIGGVTAVYAYTFQRLGYSIADYATQREVEYSLDVVDRTINLSQVCTFVPVGSNNCLKCTLPANCSDVNNDGILDTCAPNAINRRGQERWGSGERVWFYQADLTGLPGNPGGILWMAQRADDVTPVSANRVKAFTYFPGNTIQRLDLMQTASGAYGTYSNSFYTQIKVGAYATGTLRAAAQTADTSTSYQLALGRTIYMHGWRP